jgi:hypothetical protein
VFSRRELLDWFEQPLVISQHGLDSRTFDALPLNLRTQLNQIVGCRNRDEQETIRHEYARAFFRVASRVQRDQKRQPIVNQRQTTIGVGDDPGECGESSRGMAAGRDRQVDADATRRAAGQARCECVARSGTEVGDSRVVRQRRRCESLPGALNQGTSDSCSEQAGASLDNRVAVPGGQRSAILRLKKIDVAAAGDVVRVTTRANVRPILTFELKSAVTNCAGEEWNQRLENRGWGE